VQRGSGLIEPFTPRISTPFFEGLGKSAAGPLLRAWTRSHPKLGYDLLFGTIAQALQDLAANPKRLGAQLGMLGVLRTWSRTLIFHPHISLPDPRRRLEPRPTPVDRPFLKVPLS
jgi:hypothetical protein